MATQYDNTRRRKAFLYTALICSLLLIAFIFINWKVLPPAPPVILQQIEINLGNNNEGFGDIQPLVKGEPTPEPIAAEPVVKNAAEQVENNESTIIPDDNAPLDAAPVEKPVIKPLPKKITREVAKPITKPIIKPAVTVPVATPTPKPRTPKVIMTGPGKGGGNNATQDNGYTMQGKNKNGTGDNGDPSGNTDTYGKDKSSTKVGGPKVISGNRKVVRYYSFTGELDKATINAVIKVSPEGVGTYLRIGQGSTSTNGAYANAIKGYLQSMKFDIAEEESTVTVQFNFNIQ